MVSQPQGAKLLAAVLRFNGLSIGEGFAELADERGEISLANLSQSCSELQLCLDEEGVLELFQTLSNERGVVQLDGWCETLSMIDSEQVLLERGVDPAVISAADGMAASAADGVAASGLEVMSRPPRVLGPHGSEWSLVDCLVTKALSAIEKQDTKHSLPHPTAYQQVGIDSVSAGRRKMFSQGRQGAEPQASLFDNLSRSTTSCTLHSFKKLASLEGTSCTEMRSSGVGGAWKKDDRESRDRVEAAQLTWVTRPVLAQQNRCGGAENTAFRSTTGVCTTHVASSVEHRGAHRPISSHPLSDNAPASHLQNPGRTKQTMTPLGTAKPACIEGGRGGWKGKNQNMLALSPSRGRWVGLKRIPKAQSLDGGSLLEQDAPQVRSQTTSTSCKPTRSSLLAFKNVPVNAPSSAADSWDGSVTMGLSKARERLVAAREASDKMRLRQEEQLMIAMSIKAEEQRRSEQTALLAVRLAQQRYG